MKEQLKALLVLAVVWKMVSAVRQALEEKRKKKLIAEAIKIKGYSVGIIGAGVGGIATAKKCLDLGIPFQIYEVAEDYGGTWLYNKCKKT